MPNWAYGPISVTGTQQNISQFISRFLFEEDRTVDSHRMNYFARSFTGARKEYVMRDIRQLFEGRGKDAVDTFSFEIDFAWSAQTCLVDGYPQQFPECITLEDACVLDSVYVEILTEEGGMCFEEHITCDSKGNLTSCCSNLAEYICQNCKNTTFIASFNDLEEYECDECGESRWEPSTPEKQQDEDHA